MQPNIQQHVYGALIVAVFVSGGLAPASAQDVIPVTLGAHVSYMTRYLFAGVPFSTGGVMQGTVDLGYGSWTFHAFTNYDFDTEEINEGDVWGDYYHQFNDKLGGFIGGAAYNFKFASGWDMTPEIYGGLVLYVTGTPTLYYARDFDLTTGDHTVLTLTHGIPAGTNVTVQATGPLRKLQASGKKLYYIGIDQAAIDKINEKFGTTFVALTIKSGTLPGQDADFVSGFNRGYKAAHPEFPEELAYQFVMGAYKHADEMRKINKLWEMMTDKMMLDGLTEENTHPGAMRAFKELGIWDTRKGTVPVTYPQ